VSEELKCEVCNEPATHTLSGTWSGSTAGPICYCVEHMASMAEALVREGDDDCGDGVLLHFTVGRLADERTDEEVGWDAPPAGLPPR
jgi:hypothetical protein